MVRMYSKISGKSEISTAAGYFISAGTYYKVSEHVSIGLQWKRSRVDLTIGDHAFDSGGSHLTILGGFSY
ncbi:MAG: hypothetical protein KKD44_22770 [Proteobacteria bacterium]|nr:hypothetical protein [Pseudomonadota bacterium]